MRSLFFIILFLSSLICLGKNAKPVNLQVDLASPAEVKVLSATALITQDVIIEAQFENAGNIRLGSSSITSTSGIELTPGMIVMLGNFTQAASILIDLNEWYISGANAADGVNILYISYE